MAKTLTAREKARHAVRHAALNLVADYPGQFGPLRIARLIGGYEVSHREGESADTFAGYRSAMTEDMTLTDIANIVRGMRNELTMMTPGNRPVVVLTRAGWIVLHGSRGNILASWSDSDLIEVAMQGASHWANWRNADDGRLQLQTIDDDDSADWFTLTGAMLLAAAHRTLFMYPDTHAAYCIRRSDLDAEAGDVLAQVAILGKIVYG